MTGPGLIQGGDAPTHIAMGEPSSLLLFENRRQLR